MPSQYSPTRIAHSMAFIADIASKATNTEYDYNEDTKNWEPRYVEVCTAQELIDGATAYLDHGEYMSNGGMFEGFSVPKEFWHHYRIVTGRKVEFNDMDQHFFSCSC